MSIEEVTAPLTLYALGHATGDPTYFRRAFLPTAHVEGLRDGEFCSWSLDRYCDLFDGRPAADEADRVRTLDEISVQGTVATAAMTLRHGEATFTDMFVLLCIDGDWRIANKVYHRHGAEAAHQRDSASPRSAHAVQRHPGPP